ncbi:MAG: LysE family translocator [Hyphomicrobiales bacterium]|nr:LysE family translocator [Hyphomicrobiales bacterium]MBV8824739.1 LysE family translocator [Hyphomicrobiales bacterium]MBV9428999.1 LysE family translocator [Bradyrhizobiaceae bacterium]
MTLMPDPQVLLAFTLAGVVLIVTPGPDMALFLGQTLTAGRTRGFAAMLGVTTGTVLHSLIAAFGLSALLAASVVAFTALKIAGVAYLVWLAIGALRRGSAFTLRKDAARRPLGQVYLMGLGCNLLNPKIIMFFVTFLPQFVSATDPHAGAKLLFLGLYFVALAVPLCALLILLADLFTAAIRRSPRATRAVDWLFAGLMGTFAVRLLLWSAD